MISVIIPTYDNNEMLKNLLDKLDTQSVLPDEVIIIEDGPADTQEIITNGNYFFKTTKIKHETNIGVNASWNEGINHSKGEFICILNDDIMISNEFIRKTLDTFNKDALNGIVVYRKSSLEEVDNEPEGINYFSSVRRIGWACSVRRKMMDLIMPIPTKGMKDFCGDDYIFSKCRSNGFRVAELLTCNVWHFGSASILKKYKVAKFARWSARSEKNVYEELKRK